jgi:protein Mpv17
MTASTMRLIALLALASTTDAFAPVAPLVTRSTSSLNAFDIGATANLIGAVDTFYHTQPYAAAFVTCSVKASAADLVVQSKTEDDASATTSVEEQTNDFDISRTFAFWLYGGLYQGCMQEYLFNNVFPSVFGDSQSWITVLEEVSLDMAVLTPFLCLPVAYLVKASVAEDENLFDGLSKYWNHVQNEKLLIRYWSLWAPVQVLTFGFVPHHLRIPFIAFVSFFWLMTLSNISAQADSSSTDGAAAVAE